MFGELATDLKNSHFKVQSKGKCNVIYKMLRHYWIKKPLNCAHELLDYFKHYVYIVKFNVAHGEPGREAALNLN